MYFSLVSVVVLWYLVKYGISDILVRLYDEIILELWCIMDSMAAGDLFFKWYMEKIIFSE